MIQRVVVLLLFGVQALALSPFAVLAASTTSATVPAPPVPRQAAPDRPAVAGPGTRPVFPFTMPSPGTRPSGQAFASWETAALFRLEALRCAADESPLPAELKEKLGARVRQARADVDAVSARYAGGALRSVVARQSVDAVMGRLMADTAAMLGARAGAFSERVDKTMGEAQLFADRDPARGELIVEASVKLEDEQRLRIDSVLENAARQVRAIESKNAPDALARRHAVGFATRAAVRRVLRPEQLTAFDGPFQAPAAGAAARPPSNEPATGPATAESPGLSEAQAIALIRLESMRYAVLEGGYAPDVKESLTGRVEKGARQVREMSSATTAPSFGADDERVGRIYSSVLADAAATLHSRVTDLIRRQNRIYQDVTEISSAGKWRGRAGLDRLKLTDSQRLQIDRDLSDGAEKISALDRTASLTAPSLQAPRERYSELLMSPVGPAAKSLRCRQVAFEIRAALRAALTPEQQAAWDAAEGN